MVDFRGTGDKDPAGSAEGLLSTPHRDRRVSPKSKSKFKFVHRHRAGGATTWLLVAAVCVVLLLSVCLTSKTALPRLHRASQPVATKPARKADPPGGRASTASTSSSGDKAIVLASYDGQDTTWVDDIPADWTIYKYTLKGREARAYLTFIVDNYHNLPDYTIFHHGANTSWHQIEPIGWKVRALSLDALDREGYINLRCQHDSGCTDDSLIGAAHTPIKLPQLRKMIGNMTISFWNELLQPYGFGKLPDHIGHQCCAQFAVTRSAIQARSHDFYKDYREPLETPVDAGRKRFGPNWDFYHSGALFEYMWHIVFGKEALYCPAEDMCRKEFFSDAIHCDRYPGRYDTAFGWRSISCTNVWDHGAKGEANSRMVTMEGEEEAERRTYDGLKEDSAE